MKNWKFTEKLALGATAAFVLFSVLVSREAFFHGLLRHIVVTVLIVVAFLPLYVIKRLMKIKDEPGTFDKWSVKKRILFTVVAVVYALVMLFTVGMSIDKIYTIIIGNDVPSVIYSPFYAFPFAAVVELSLMFIFFFNRNGIILLGSSRSLPTKKRIAGFAAGAAVCVLIASLCFFSYSVVTPNGVERVSFGRTTVYTWEDAEQVRLSSRFDGTLRIEVVFSDGTRQVILGATCAENDMLAHCYLDGVDQMVCDCVSALHRKSVPFSEQENIEEKLEYDYWKEYLVSLRGIYCGGE